MADPTKENVPFGYSRIRMMKCRYLFHEVKNWVKNRKLNTRDICILVKQQLTQYAGNLIKYFNQNGIKARDENRLQDMITQEVSIFIIHSLYAIFDKSNTRSRQIAFIF